MNFYEKVYNIVKQIPKGKVATYGQIAFLCDSPKASRAVGYALHKNPDPCNIHCYKIVNKQGELASSFAFGGKDKQKELLEKDGVEVSSNYKVDLEKYLWKVL